MNHCCSSHESPPVQGRVNCPACGRACLPVPRRTIMQHLAHPWRYPLSEQTYHFCDDPDCSVVYFGADGSVLDSNRLRTPVGVKSRSDDAPLCHCFGISRAQAREEPAARAFVVEQTRLGLCACETRNPSGRCCLKDFPRLD